MKYINRLIHWLISAGIFLFKFAVVLTVAVLFLLINLRDETIDGVEL